MITNDSYLMQREFSYNADIIMYFVRYITNVEHL
jgi:hypothetical protein